ncbi:MAG: VTT domain-containing protein [Bryobacteraceae bacterium]
MTHLLQFVIEHGYALIFIWVLAEQAALPLPSVPLLLACGALASGGRLSLSLVVLYGVAGCLLADNVWFEVGRRRGARVLRLLCRVALEPDSCVRRTESAFVRYGVRSLLVSKFVPGLNAVAAPLAAISGVSRARFFLFDTSGAFLWMLAYCGLGYVFSGELDRLADAVERMGSSVLALAAALVIAWIAWKYDQRRRFLKKLAVSRITAGELREMLESGCDVTVVDVRSAIENEEDLIPGALRIPLEELEERHQDVPRDRDVILVCT